MSDDIFHLHPLLTYHGNDYHCSMAPIHTFSGALDRMEGERLALLGIRGQRDLDPDLAYLLMERRWKAKAEPRWAKLDELLETRESTATEMAQAFRSEEAQAQLASAIKDLGEDNVAIPPIFGLADYSKGMSRLLRETGRNVFEVVTPMSLPGLRLQAAMERAAMAQGCRLLRGREVISLHVEGDVARYAILRSPTRQRVVKFNSVIVATGDAVGGGMRVIGRTMHDPFASFRVGLFKEGEARPMAAAEESGYLVGNDMRLISVEGAHLRNVFGAGAALAGFSFPTGVGLGGSLITAYVAAQSAEEIS